MFFVLHRNQLDYITRKLLSAEVVLQGFRFLKMEKEKTGTFTKKKTHKGEERKYTERPRKYT